MTGLMRIGTAIVVGGWMVSAGAGGQPGSEPAVQVPPPRSVNVSKGVAPLFFRVSPVIVIVPSGVVQVGTPAPEQQTGGKAAEPAPPPSATDVLP